MQFQKRVITYVDVDLEPGDLLSQAEAARELNISLPGLRSAIDRGNFTEIIDPDALSNTRFRRFVLKAEVQEEVARRQRLAEKWGGNDGD